MAAITTTASSLKRPFLFDRCLKTLITGKCFCTSSPALLLIVPAVSLLTCIHHFVLLVFPHSLSRADILIHLPYLTYCTAAHHRPIGIIDASCVGYSIPHGLIDADLVLSFSASVSHLVTIVITIFTIVHDGHVRSCRLNIKKWRLIRLMA
jgi:hypothetical protein